MTTYTGASIVARGSGGTHDSPVWYCQDPGSSTSVNQAADMLRYNTSPSTNRYVLGANVATGVPQSAYLDWDNGSTSLNALIQDEWAAGQQVRITLSVYCTNAFANSNTILVPAPIDSSSITWDGSEFVFPFQPIENTDGNEIMLGGSDLGGEGEGTLTFTYTLTGSGPPSYADPFAVLTLQSGGNPYSGDFTAAVTPVTGATPIRASDLGNMDAGAITFEYPLADPEFVPISRPGTRRAHFR